MPREAPVARTCQGLALSAALLSCAPAWSAPPPTIRAPHLTPAISTPEAGLWDQSDRAEHYVKTSADLDGDAQLTAWVRATVCKIAPEYCDDLRVYVLDRPVLNASAAPNGYIEVNSGLLLRAQTEDELAYVLGHEVSHFSRNHSLERWQAAKDTANTMLVLQIGVSAVAAGAQYSAASGGGPNAQGNINSISQAAQSLNSLIYLGGVAAFFAYNREQETEADRLGFGRATIAGYSPRAGASMWNAVIAETAASDFASIRKSEGRASMFNTHPVTAARVVALQDLAGKASAQTNESAGHTYRARIHAHLSEWLKDDLRRRDYGQSLHIIDRLEALGEDMGLLEFYRGEALRQRRQEGDAPLALKAYRAAVAAPDVPVQAWRELAEASRKAGDKAGARAAFETYLAKAPQAQDRWLVEAGLKSLQPAGTP